MDQPNESNVHNPQLKFVGIVREITEKVNTQLDPLLLPLTIRPNKHKNYSHHHIAMSISPHSKPTSQSIKLSAKLFAITNR